MKQQNKSKRIIVGSIITIVVFGLYGLMLSFGSHESMYVDRPEGRLCKMPIDGVPSMVTVAPGLVFKIDTGADASSITEKDLATLESLGYKAEHKIYPVFGRNGWGRMNWTFTRFQVDLPLYNYISEEDSLGNISHQIIPESLNVLHDVDFVPSSTGFSVLGVDFLQKFKIEYLYEEKVVALSFDTPEGYEPFAELSVSHSPLKDMWQGNRYYISISVQNIKNDYFLDTGLQRAKLRLPMSEYVRSSTDLVSDTIRTMIHKHPALVDYDAWVCIGDRCGTAAVWYCDTNEEPYTFNPFNYIEQDFLLDLNGKKLMLKPHSYAFFSRIKMNGK